MLSEEAARGGIHQQEAVPEEERNTVYGFGSIEPVIK